MDASDWRDQLHPETRQQKLNEIMDILKTRAAFNDEDGFRELQKIAQSIEEETYASATSQDDYLQKLDSKMCWVKRAAWRSQLKPDSRQRVVNKIVDTLKRHIPVSSQEGLYHLRMSAQRFEGRILRAATSQSDYLRRISLKMLMIETRLTINLPSNQLGSSNDPPDPGFGMQSRVYNRGRLHAKHKRKVFNKIGKPL